MSAAPKNKYAQKDPKEVVKSAITIRGTIAEQAAWKAAHKGSSVSWNDWCRNALNKASGKG